MKKALLAVTLLLFWASSAVGQRGGIPTFTASDNFEYDTVNLTTLTPVVHFPLLSKGGGGSSIAVESPQSCHVTGTSMYCGYQNNLLPGFFFVPSEFGALQAVGTISLGSCNNLTVTGFMGWDGLTIHPISQVVVYQNSGCGVTSATATTIDGSGITATFGYPAVAGVDYVSSSQNTSGWTWTNSTGKIADPFGNTMTWGTPGGSFTDLLGAVTTLGNGAQGFGSPSSYGYTDAGGNSRTISLVAGTATTFQPIGNCPLVANGGTAVTPVSSISFPDSTSISLTWDTNNSGIDGMIKSFTTREGGTITYTYGTVTCNGWYFNTLSRQTPDGTISYSASYASGITTTTVKDPGLNKTVYTFFTNGSPAAPSQTSTITRYQNTGTVASPSYTEISSTTYCYNNHTCTTAPTYPITQLDTYEYTYKPDTTQVQMSHDVKLFDSTYGLLTSDAATDSITSQTITTTYVYGSDSSGTCVAITNTAIVDHPCTITTKNGTTWLSGSTYTYNANGALTSSSACLTSTCTGSSALTTTYTPNTTGTYSAIQDPNGQTVNYTYGSCNSLMPTDVTTTVNSIAIDRKATWNCNAGVVTDTTDPNSNEDDYTYDSMNRIHTYHDRMGDTNTTTYDYGTPTLDHVKVTDNIGVVSYQYVDGLGRQLISQVYNGTNYDTVSTAYSWNGTNFQTLTKGGSSSPACTAALDTACTTTTLTALTNPISGPYTTTDANSGVGTYAVNSKDFSFTASPAPTGEHTKVVQTEVDGFGRVSSTCALTATGYDGRVACGQTMAGNGTLTSNTYTFPSAGVSEVQTTRGSQTHTAKADAAGRTTSYQNPEAGTTTATYDSIAANFCFTGSAASSSAGDLVGTTDAASNKICMYYDGLHRLTDVGNSNQSNTNPAKRYRYDSTANNYATKPTGYPATGNNLVGRLMEAETDYNAVTLTDEWFAYDAMGRITDMWESTPNSSGFYHITVAYDADGQITSLSGIPTYSSITFGNFDSEDRPTSMKYGTTTIVNSTGFTYDAAGNPTNVPISTGSDADVFTWDNLGHMLTYKFNVGTKHDKGTLTWNSIGSLGQLVIDDTITSSTDSQTCAYAYDDVARLTSEATVTGSTCNGPMTYTYDQYDNLTQAGTFSWNPGYNGTTSNNEQTGSTYDSDGNVKTDGVNSYTWNLYGKIASARSGNSAAVCGTSGMCYTYDALGHLVEWQFNGGTSQYVYSPLGRVAKMNGQTTTWAFVPAPGGGHLWQSGTTSYFVHTDWLGTERMVDTIGGTNYNAQAYTAYGQQYDTLGSGFQFFTGLLQDESGANLYLTPNRNLFQNSGRWLSPDPAHSGWNAYAYVTDPNTQTDPSGLGPNDPNQQFPFPDTTGIPNCGKDPNGCGVGDAGSGDILVFKNPDTLSGQTFAGGFWGPEGPHGHDYAAGMINSRILSDVFNASSWGQVGRRWWRNLKGGGCQDLAPGQICQGAVTPVGGGEWEAPTFEVFQPSEEVLSDVRGFVKEHPEYINAKCGQCGEATGKFLQYGLDRGRYYAWQNINRGEGGPLFQQITNPMFDYTVVYGREGLVHAVNLSPDGKWAIDMSATQFRNDYPPRWVSYPMIIPVDPNSF